MADDADDFASQEDRLKAAWRAAVLRAVEEQNTPVPVPCHQSAGREPPG